MKVLKDVSEYFDFLLTSLKFKIYSGRALGKRSGIIELKNDKIKIKFVSERNQTFIEVGSADQRDWCELSILRYLLRKIPITFMNLENSSNFLKENLDIIEDLYLDKKNIDRIEELKYKVANKIL